MQLCDALLLGLGPSLSIEPFKAELEWGERGCETQSSESESSHWSIVGVVVS